jgi:dTDP-4-amino-4,6-dideoxygalactose transaminase
MPRLYLSPPHLGTDELELVREAFASNWVAPIGPHLDAFEKELAQVVGVRHAVALSSGTAALHLALRLIGVRPGDEVICPTLTFCASANPIVYEGGAPVFLDVEPASWNLDPQLLRDELRDRAARGRLPRAVVSVDLYGQSADYDALLDACNRYDVPLIEDAAEALGASYRGRMSGSFGRCAAFSFNGNKIITTSGGGMLVSDDAALIEQARFLATQARDPAPHYQHSRIGFNYRMSNILAAIGRGQLRHLPDRVAARRRILDHYRDRLSDLAGLEFLPEAPQGSSNAWLTCITVDPHEFGASCDDIRRALEAADVESRPLWKPLHLQPVFAGYRYRGGDVASSLFERGLCLPSGSAMTEADLERVIGIIRGVAKGPCSRRSERVITGRCSAGTP